MCIGIVTGGSRVDLARTLLNDLTRQTTPPAEVIVIVQEGMGGTSASPTLDANEFPTLPLSVRTNPGRRVTEARNIILRDCRSDVVVFMDDDAGMPQDAIENIVSGFRKHPQAAAIIFKARWIGETDRPRTYPNHEHQWRTVWSATSVAQIEIAASARGVRNLGVRFDERFGPGADHPTGDEFLFIVDILRRKGEIWFIPLEISSHEAQSSGQNLDEAMLRAKGAVYRRTFGLLGLFVATAFVFQKALRGQLRCRVVTAMRAAIDGWMRFPRTQREAGLTRSSGPERP